jgi:hypothetical protein
MFVIIKGITGKILYAGQSASLAFYDGKVNLYTPTGGSTAYPDTEVSEISINGKIEYSNALF